MKSNPATGELSGRVGDLVFVRRKDGEVVVRKRPVRKAPKRTGEAANQQGFADAVAYAKGVWENQPELRTKYETVARSAGRQGFHVAKADFRRRPEVREVDTADYAGSPGSLIRIEAVDDFEVAQVKVVLRTLAGDLIEEGYARFEDDRWLYASKTQVKTGQTIVIEATATDHPGHKATKQVHHAVGGQK